MKNTYLLLIFLLLGTFSNMYSALPSPNINFVEATRLVENNPIAKTDPIRSNLKITYPNARTTWTLPRFAKIDWETTNIDKDKKIRFFLVKDDVVVQDLGIYQNNNSKDSIRLDRGLATGNNYRVMGIEQNPINTSRIAKFATPFFTIIKAPRKKKQEKAVVKEAVIQNKIKSSPVISEAEKTALRYTFDERSISYNKVLEVDHTELRIRLWDHGRIDGDLVSIYLNGQAVVHKHSLTGNKKEFEIVLNPNIPNDLFLYAHNLGRFAPNTVAIEIVDGDDSENIVLNSDLKSCEAVVIKVKK